MRRREEKKEGEGGIIRKEKGEEVRRIREEK